LHIIWIKVKSIARVIIKIGPAVMRKTKNFGSIIHH
jgi:hypothetical protein